MPRPRHRPPHHRLGGEASSGSSGSSHNLWKSCGSSADHYKIYSVNVYPSTPRIGHNLTINIAGQLDETVYFGYGSVVLQWNSVPILNCTKDLCNTDPSIKCPIPPGVFDYSHNVTLSGNLIPGHYTGTVTLVDQNAAELCCVDLDVTLAY